MLKTRLKEEHKAKAHKEAAHAMVLAFITQLANDNLPIEEWERTMKKLDEASAAVTGRWDALWDLRNDVSCRREFDRDANYKRRNDSWVKYYLLLRKIA